MLCTSVLYGSTNIMITKTSVNMVARKIGKLMRPIKLSKPTKWCDHYLYRVQHYFFLVLLLWLAPLFCKPHQKRTTLQLHTLSSSPAPPLSSTYNPPLVPLPCSSSSMSMSTTVKPRFIEAPLWVLASVKVCPAVLTRSGLKGRFSAVAVSWAIYREKRRRRW